MQEYTSDTTYVFQSVNCQKEEDKGQSASCHTLGTDAYTSPDRLPVDSRVTFSTLSLRVSTFVRIGCYVSNAQRVAIEPGHGECAFLLREVPGCLRS